MHTKGQAQIPRAWEERTKVLISWRFGCLPLSSISPTTPSPGGFLHPSVTAVQGCVSTSVEMKHRGLMPELGSHPPLHSAGPSLPSPDLWAECLGTRRRSVAEICDEMVRGKDCHCQAEWLLPRDSHYPRGVNYTNLCLREGELIAKHFTIIRSPLGASRP